MNRKSSREKYAGFLVLLFSAVFFFSVIEHQSALRRGLPKKHLVVKRAPDIQVSLILFLVPIQI